MIHWRRSSTITNCKNALNPWCHANLRHFSILSTRSDTGVFVSDVVKGGLVDADGRLTQGDQILSVNGEDVRSATQEAVAALLKVAQLKW